LSGSDSSDGLTETLLVTRLEGIARFETGSKDEELLIRSPAEALLLEPASSPDGGRIAYVRQLTPFVRPGDVPQAGMDLYVADRDGANSKLLIEHGQPNEMVRDPAWLPDGRRLLVSVQRIEQGRFVISLEQVDIETGARTVLRQGPFSLALSADGSKLAYLEIDASLNQTLRVANLDGSGARVIAGPAQGLVSFTSPRFSPDGRFLVFGAGEPIEQQISAGPQRFVSAAGGVAPASFARSPLFDGTPKDIWLYDLTTGELRKLADLNVDDPSLGWSRDGEQLFVYAGAGLFALDSASGESTRLAEGMFHGFMDVVQGG
jgi:Tol biopolymer transport system component